MLQLNFICCLFGYLLSTPIFFFCVADRQHYLSEPTVPSPRTQEHLQNRPLGFGGRYSLSLNPKEPSEINLIKFLIFKVILDTLKGQMPKYFTIQYCIYASDKKILSQSKLGQIYS